MYYEKTVAMKSVVSAMEEGQIENRLVQRRNSPVRVF